VNAGLLGSSIHHNATLNPHPLSQSIDRSGANGGGGGQSQPRGIDSACVRNAVPACPANNKEAASAGSRSIDRLRVLKARGFIADGRALLVVCEAALA
jgi:hypothetical protein